MLGLGVFLGFPLKLVCFHFGFWVFQGFLRGTLLGVPLKGYYKGTIRVPLKGSIRVFVLLIV